MKKLFLLLLFLLTAISPRLLIAQETQSFEVIVNLDAEGPITTHNYSGQWYNQDFSITLTAVDTQTQVKNTYYRINNGQQKSIKSNGQPFITTEGANNILEYWSVDEFNNEETHKFLTGIKLDRTPPVIFDLTPGDETTVNENRVDINGSVNDTLSGVEYLEITIQETTLPERKYTPAVNAQGKFSISDVEITGGPNTITFIAGDYAHNASSHSITTFLGWMLHIKIPYYEKTQNNFSGAASCQMILNYIRNGVIDKKTNQLSLELGQKEIFDYGHAFNYLENSSLDEMDPRSIDYALGHFDPYDSYDPHGEGISNKGYNFGIESFSTDKFTDYLRDIIYWIAYPVKVEWNKTELVKYPNTPSVIPAYGKYNHWIIVNGAATSENPIPKPIENPSYTPDFTIYGIWLTDPLAGGIGQDLYVTAKDLGQTYFQPVVSADQYHGKYVHVAEPPETNSSAYVKIAETQTNKETLKIIEIAKDITKETAGNLSYADLMTENFLRHIYDAALVVNLQNDAANNKDLPATEWRNELLTSVFNVSESPLELDWKKIVDASLLRDENFRNAFDESQARKFIKVRRTDKENCFYYLIPFDKYVNGQFLTYAAIIIDAQDGCFKEASWVEKPARFVPIDKQTAINLVLTANAGLTRASLLDMELIWEPGGPSSSPFYPYWKISSLSGVYYVIQKGEIIPNE